MTAVTDKNSAYKEQLAGKYLSFFLSREEYGIAILRVREIIGVVTITPLPRTPDYVTGVINLRGKIIPVIDLRAKFGMPKIEAKAESCIVVVDLQREGDGQVTQTGCIVDTVSEVLSVEAAQVDLAPRCARVRADYLLGLGKLPEKVLILLDIDRILADEAAELEGRALAEVVG